MEKDNEYVAAHLSPELVAEIKSLEDRLSEEANKKVVVIAYEEE